VVVTQGLRLQILVVVPLLVLVLELRMSLLYQTNNYQTNSQFTNLYETKNENPFENNNI
jgi:hypothetical protein